MHRVGHRIDAGAVALDAAGLARAGAHAALTAAHTGVATHAAISGVALQAHAGRAAGDHAATGERIIKEGIVTIEVDEGQFDVAYGQIIGRAQALGGHVVGSTSTTTDDGLVRGSVTVRVPVQSFEDLLTSLGDAGEILDP